MPGMAPRVSLTTSTSCGLRNSLAGPLGTFPGGRSSGCWSSQSLPWSTLTGSALEFADEGEHEGRDRLVINLVGRADLLDLSIAHHHDAVGQFECLLLVVGNEHGGVSGLFVNFEQPAAELFANLGVERAERLVEQKQAWLDGEGARERDTLALAAGQLRRITLLQTLELNQLDELERSLADLGGTRPLIAGTHLQAESDIAEHGHVPEQRIVLEDETHIARLHRQMKRILSVKGHAAGSRLVEPGQDAEESRFAGA